MEQQSTSVSAAGNNGLRRLLFSAKGRVGRKEYWSYQLAVLVCAFALILLGHAFEGGIAKALLTLCLILLAIIVVWSSIVIQIKRLHDLGRSGWFVLINLVPYIGSLVTLVWLGFFPGTQGPNCFGDPGSGGQFTRH